MAGMLASLQLKTKPGSSACRSTSAKLLVTIVIIFDWSDWGTKENDAEDTTQNACTPSMQQRRKQLRV